MNSRDDDPPRVPQTRVDSPSKGEEVPVEPAAGTPGESSLLEALHHRGTRSPAPREGVAAPVEGETDRFEHYHMLGEIASIRADHHAALEWIGQALENWRVVDTPRGLSETLAFKGFLHYQTEQLDHALKAFEEAMEIDEELDDAPRLSAGYRRMAMVYEKNLELPRSRSLYEKSLEIEQEQGNDEGIARVYHHLGRLAELDEDWDQAKEQYEASLALKESLGDEAGMAATWHQLGNLHIKTRELNEAAEDYQKALRFELKLGDREGQARTLAQLGLARIDLDQPQEALRDLVQSHNILQRLRSPLAGEVLSKLEELQDVIPPETFNAIVRGTDNEPDNEPGDE